MAALIANSSCSDTRYPSKSYNNPSPPLREAKYPHGERSSNSTPSPLPLRIGRYSSDESSSCSSTSPLPQRLKRYPQNLGRPSPSPPNKEVISSLNRRSISPSSSHRETRYSYDHRRYSPSSPSHKKLRSIISTHGHKSSHLEQKYSSSSKPTSVVRGKRTRSRSRDRCEQIYKKNRYESESDESANETTDKELKIMSMQSKDGVVHADLSSKEAVVTSEETSSSFLFNLRASLGCTLFEKYLHDVVTIEAKLNEEYEVYNTMPEFHPDYEIHFEKFIKDSSKVHRIIDDNTRDQLFSNHWKTILGDIKNDDLEWRKLQVVTELQLKAKSSSTNTSASNKEFSINETFLLLESLCEKIGVLGVALKDMINMSRQVGIDSQKSCDIFKDPENLIVIGMILNKFEILKKSSTDSIYKQTFTNAIDWTNQFLKYAKERKKFDVIALAKATYRQPHDFTINVIEAAVKEQGGSSFNKDKLNELFMEVCNLHFEFQMNT